MTIAKLNSELSEATSPDQTPTPKPSPKQFKPRQTQVDTNGRLTEELSVIINGPVHHYVTPKFHNEHRPSTGWVLTWNHSAAEAYGTATVFFDCKAKETGDFLQKQISGLSHHAETSIVRYVGNERKP